MPPQPHRTLALAVIGLSLALAYGIWYSYSVVLVALLDEFGWSRSVLAGAFSLFTLLHGGVNPLVGALCVRAGPLRVTAAGGAAIALALLAVSSIGTPLGLYLAFGVLTALAVALAGWVPALVHVQRHFQDRLGLSIGIISAGVGVGMTLVVPLTQWLIDAAGWRNAYRVLGLVCFLWITPASLWLMRRKGPAPAAQRRGADDARPGAARAAGHAMTLRQAMRTQPFWLLIAAYFFGNVSSQTLHVHQVAYLVDHGVAALVAATVVGVVGLASIFGKTGGGWLSDRIDRELVYMGGIAILAGAAFALLSIGASPAPWQPYAYAVLLGLGYSVTAAITPAMVADRFSGPHFGSIVGVGLMANAAGSAFGPWLAGRLYDASGSYALAFTLSAASGALAGCAAWRARALRRVAGR
ncbi:MAG TPA: MFS transporter [Burkholderiales bacterium]